MKCNKRTEVYSRIVGYFRPIQNWNEGKKQEFIERRVYALPRDGATDQRAFENNTH